MLRVTLAGVRGHLLRFLLTTTSVMLGVAFVAGTFVLTDSLQVTFDKIFNGASAGTDVVVRGGKVNDGIDETGDLRTPLDLSLADELARVSGVQAAYPDVEGTAVLVGRDGTAVRNGGAPSFGFAYREDDESLPMTGGRAPTASDEVAVEQSTLDRSGLEVGDRTRLVVAGTVQPVTVVGTVSFAGGLAGATIVVVDEASATRWFAADGTVQRMSLRADDGISQAVLRDRVAAVLPSGVEALTGEAFAEEQRTAFAEGLRFLNIFLLVFAAVSLLVGAFIIFNTFSMLVAQRTRELALLRALGASGRQVVRVVLGESVVIGLAGSLAGLGAGVGLAYTLQALVASFGLTITGGLPVRPRTVVAAVGIGMVVTVLAAVLPALRAGRIAPVAAMRDDIALPERSLRLRGSIGGVLLAAGVAVMVYAVSLSGNDASIGVGIGAFVAFVATVVLAPSLARPVVAVLATPFVWTSKVVPRLLGHRPAPVSVIARDNTLRNPRRTGVTAVALLIGLALVSVVAIFAQSTKASVNDIVDREVTADLILSGGNSLFPTAISDKVAALPGVAAVVDSRAVPVRVDGDTSVGAAVSGAGLEQTVDLDVLAGSLRSLDSGAVALSRSYAARRGREVGDTLEATLGTLTGRSYPVGAVYEDSQAIGVPVLVPRSLYADAVPTAFQSAFAAYVKVEDGADPAAVRRELTDLVRPLLVVQVLDKGEFKSDQAAQVDTLLGILYGLLGLAVVIATLGIVNTLALSVFERTREIGLLRAVGYSRGQVRRTITVESVVIALFGAVLGTALGVGIGIALQRTLVDDGLKVLGVPYGQVAGMFVVAGLAGLAASILPAWRAARLDVLKAVATE